MIDMTSIVIRRLNSDGIAYGQPITAEDLPHVVEAVEDEICETDADADEVQVGGQRYRWRKLARAVKVGAAVGRTMARDVVADGLPREWTGLDPQDGDRLTAAGIEPGTPEWNEAEEAARVAYEETVR
jgi:hypothetical protein